MDSESLIIANSSAAIEVDARKQGVERVGALGE